MAAHRNRLRVRVRSFVTDKTLRYVSERDARLMCAENSDGSDMLGADGLAMEPTARRLTRLKASLTDIKLLRPERQERQSPCTITLGEMDNYAFVHEGVKLSAKDRIAPIDAALQKIEAWPGVHDDRNTVIAAGVAIGVFCPWPQVRERVVTFA